MENFDLNRLSTDRDHLIKVLKAFVEMQTKLVRVVSQNDVLKIFGHNDKRRFTGSVTTNYMSASFEYLGDSGGVYCKPDELIKILSSNGPSKFEIPGYAQPLGWEEELMDRSFRGTEGVSFDPKELKEAISYLLRVDLTNCESDYFGIIFCGKEMMTTNGKILLARTGVPELSTIPRLLGFDAAMALYTILRSPYVSELQMGVSKKSSIFGIRTELDDGGELFIWSKPRIGPIDNFKDPRPPVSPTSIGFVVEGQYLDSILEHTIKAVIDNEKPALRIQTAQNGALCSCYGADEKGIDSPRLMFQGNIPITRTMGTQDIAICVRADLLQQAVKGMGNAVQFIIPQHPLLGLQVHEIDPFYVNCSATQFALLSPFIMEREKVISLEKLKRKANNAMD